MNVLGDRIKKERENLSLSREDLAKKLGVSYSAIAMYEQGNREPNNDIILKMCEIFNCTVDYLMGKSEFKNYEDYKKMDDYILNYALHQSQEDATLISNTLNYINTHKDESPNKIIENAVKDLPLNRRSVLFGIISHLHYKYHSHLPKQTNIKDLILKDKSSQSFTEKSNLLESYMKKNKISHMFIIPILGKITAGQPILVDENIEGYLPTDPNIYHLTDPDEYFYLHVTGNSMNKIVKDGSYVLVSKQDYAEDGDIIVAIVNGDNEATLKKYKRINDSLIVLEPQSDDNSYEPIYIDKHTNFKVIGKAIGYFGKF